MQRSLVTLEVRTIELHKGRTIERPDTKTLSTFRQSDTCQGTVPECIRSNYLYSSKIHVLQLRTPIKCIISYLVSLRRKLELGEFCTGKCIVSNCLDTLRQNDCSKRHTILKCIFTDFGHIFTKCDYTQISIRRINV